LIARINLDDDEEELEDGDDAAGLVAAPTLDIFFVLLLAPDLAPFESGEVQWLPNLQASWHEPVDDLTPPPSLGESMETVECLAT
jgi:hypothetical protein